MLILPQVTNSPQYGFHSSTAGGDILYINFGKDESIIQKVHSSDNTTISDVAKIKEWEPICIYSSKLNGDIFVGVKKIERAKIIRFSHDGAVLSEIERDKNGEPIFHDPRYITGDADGSIWVTDWNTKRIGYGKIIILDENGEYCLSYPQQKNECFYPAGISCVEEGPALVLEGETGKVMVLEKPSDATTRYRSLQENPDPKCMRLMRWEHSLVC
ncbi:uncharacterized protein LOC133205037 [Saccostrea echinata]|uniref:uncharacterized protein LOC133205037 n=1 Tax=Saccostrea echinata TaxID=191078 RepID=UPI002A8300D2|nr:uncharacterized protein LOC133205037 [Saccostrea echinata]